MACVTKYGSDALEEMEDRACKQLLEVKVEACPTQMLEHNDFVRILGKVELQAAYAFDDPSCEESLATATIYEEALCNIQVDRSDVFRAGVPAKPEDREDLMKRQLDKAQKTIGLPRAAYDYPATLGDQFQDSWAMLKGRGLHETDAKMCIWALSFYTGDPLETEQANPAALSQASSQVLRKERVKKLRSSVVAGKLREVDEDLTMIQYYLLEAMRAIPYYWGPAVRMVKLGEETVSTKYRTGNIVEWVQWSSAKRGLQPARYWEGRDTKFRIWSATGRHIDAFSNFTTLEGHDEDEVLFAPLSRFIVVNVEEKEGPTPSWVIDLREVELGLFARMPMLWVDDRVLEPDYENKEHMERAQLRSRHEVKFIAKTSTAQAMAFLSFWSGIGQAEGNNRMRILTDMTRPGEPQGDMAGARLVKWIEERHHWDACPVMVFCFDTAAAVKKIQAAGVQRDAREVGDRAQAAAAMQQRAIIVTSCAAICRAFCSFEAF